MFLGELPRFEDDGPPWLDAVVDTSPPWTAMHHGSGRVESSGHGVVLTTGDCDRGCRAVVHRELPPTDRAGWVRIRAEAWSDDYDGPRYPSAAVLSGRETAGRRVWLATRGKLAHSWERREVAAWIEPDAGVPLRVAALLVGPRRELRVTRIRVDPVRRRRMWDLAVVVTLAGWAVCALVATTRLARLAGRRHASGLAILAGTLFAAMQVPEPILRLVGRTLVTGRPQGAASPPPIDAWLPWVIGKIGGHALVFTALGAWLTLALPAQGRRVAASVLALALASESLQHLNLTRSASWLDVAIDLTGAATGAALAVCLRTAIDRVRRPR